MVNNLHITSTSYLYRSVLRLTYIKIDNVTLACRKQKRSENNIMLIFNLNDSFGFQKDLEINIRIDVTFRVVKKPVYEVLFGWPVFFTSHKCRSCYSDRCF